MQLAKLLYARQKAGERWRGAGCNTYAAARLQLQQRLAPSRERGCESGGVRIAAAEAEQLRACRGIARLAGWRERSCSGRMPL